MIQQMFPVEEEKLILRSYQEKTVLDVRTAFTRTKKVVLCLPTGGGKTASAVYMVQQAIKKGIRCVFFADQINLIDQAVKEFSRFGVRVGVQQGVHPINDPDAMCQICSPQTIAKRQLPDAGLYILDEIHHYHKIYDRVLETDAFVLGMSASPWRKGLGRKFDEVVTPVTMRHLIDTGHLVDYTVYSPPTVDMLGVKTVAGDFEKKGTIERTDKSKITGDIVSHYKTLGGDRKAICFAVNIGHANHLAKEFNRQGIDAETINCHMRNAAGGDQVKVIMDGFRNNSFKVLVSVSMLTKGFDEPDVELLVIARPTKSLSLHVQMIGRGLRQYEGSRACLILDHVGNFERLGFPDEIVMDKLDDGGNSFSEKKKKDKPEKLPKPCPSCSYLKPAGEHKCAACGFEPENIRDIETKDGELEELKRAKSDRKNYSVQEKQEFMGGLNAYAKDKNYKRSPKGNYGWAINKYKEKFNCLPSSKIDWGYMCTVNDEVKSFIQHCNIRFAKSKKGKEWAEQNRVKEINQGCKSCGCVLMKKETGIWGPHTAKQSCNNCGQFYKWGLS